MDEMNERNDDDYEHEFNIMDEINKMNEQYRKDKEN